jgi:Acetoacetate decarboxylase (ADC)
MASTNPERTQYLECAIWVGCSFQGTAGQVCLQIWVDNDFTLARGWFMGFAKKFGQTYVTEYHPLNPRMPPLGPGIKMKAYVCAHGERLMEGTLEIEKKIACEDLPRPMRLPIFHIRYFPSIARGAPPSVLELVRLGAKNVRYGENIWAGRGTLRFFPSEIEEHLPLAPSRSSAPITSARGIVFQAGRWSESPSRSTMSRHGGRVRPTCSNRA